MAFKSWATIRWLQRQQTYTSCTWETVSHLAEWWRPDPSSFQSAGGKGQAGRSPAWTWRTAPPAGPLTPVHSGSLHTAPAVRHRKQKGQVHTFSSLSWNNNQVQVMGDKMYSPKYIPKVIWGYSSLKKTNQVDICMCLVWNSLFMLSCIGGMVTHHGNLISY